MLGGIAARMLPWPGGDHSGPRMGRGKHWGHVLHRQSQPRAARTELNPLLVFPGGSCFSCYSPPRSGGTRLRLSQHFFPHSPSVGTERCSAEHLTAPRPHARGPGCRCSPPPRMGRPAVPTAHAGEEEEARPTKRSPWEPQIMTAPRRHAPLAPAGVHAPTADAVLAAVPPEPSPWLSQGVCGIRCVQSSCFLASVFRFNIPSSTRPPQNSPMLMATCPPASLPSRHPHAPGFSMRSVAHRCTRGHPPTGGTSASG